MRTVHLRRDVEVARMLGKRASWSAIGPREFTSSSIRPARVVDRLSMQSRNRFGVADRGIAVTAIDCVTRDTDECSSARTI